MPDIIKLLPDAVANQIAAGEVIQRPASVVKELTENSVDAGASIIRILVSDAGKTSIQIIDDGCGMSETDARLAFERHATSKIRSADDLFAIKTMGFRGEALASIAAVAQLEMKTRKMNDDIGTILRIEGSEVISQEPVSCPAGCNISVRNLFFNVPARRKFLKSNGTELRHIIDEVQRVALANPDVAFILIHNGSEIYNLPAGNKKQRITGIFGRNIQSNLISVNSDTSIIRIEGFIGKPEFAKKTGGQQFFFVNNRYMRHPYYYKAVMDAYTNILPPDSVPSFFIFFTIDPAQIDINIHPTKTEIKFEDERAVWQILKAIVKESLGKFNVVPSIDFEMDRSVQIPHFSKEAPVKIPDIPINPDYNPFHTGKASGNGPGNEYYRESPAKQWEKLYQGLENQKPDENQTIRHEENETASNYYQYKNRYIITAVKSGLMIINQQRAYERIMFEHYLKTIQSETNASQRSMFPLTIDFQASDSVLLNEILPFLCQMGFDMDNFGGNTFVINGTPEGISIEMAEASIESMLEKYKTGEVNMTGEVRENLCATLAKTVSGIYCKKLACEEIQWLVHRLFSCESPNYTHEGKPVIVIISDEETEKRFK